MRKEIKQELHQLIDTIQDEALLDTIYEILQNREEGQIRKSLSREQQSEVLKASDQINDPDTQTSHETMRQRNQKWLNR